MQALTVKHRGLATAKSVAARAGLSIARYTGSFDERRLRLLKSAEVQLVVDVGANIGQYATHLRRTGYTGRILSVEPIPAAHAELRRAAARDGAWDTLQVAVGGTSGTAKLHLSENSVSSSLLPMTERHERAYPESRYRGSVTVRVTTLADILGCRPEGPCFLKLDVQGHEMHVLKDAGDVLSSVAAVEVELSLSTLYEGQAPAHAILGFLQESGLTLIDLEPVCWDKTSGDLLQVNALFRTVL